MSSKISAESILNEYNRKCYFRAQQINLLKTFRRFRLVEQQCVQKGDLVWTTRQMDFYVALKENRNQHPEGAPAGIWKKVGG